jgi:hypothetical protein
MVEPATGRLARQTRIYLPKDYVVAPLSEVDPEIDRVLELELHRQRNTLEMIASENFVPRAVPGAVGSVLTNKCAEGYPGERYYGGWGEVDVAEQFAEGLRNSDEGEPVPRRVALDRRCSPTEAHG